MDLIDSFMEHTANFPSPEIFRLWAGISAVAASMERRCFTKIAGKAVYPNLFVILVSPPGIGKTQAILEVDKLWRASQRLKVAPVSMTKAALMDEMEDSFQSIPVNGHKVIEQSSLAIAVDEFGTLCPAHDLEFMSVISALYDNREVYDEKRRYARSVLLKNPQLNVLAGSQPGFLAAMLPEAAWSQGFMARQIMIYSATTPEIDLFSEDTEASPYWPDIVKHFIAATKSSYVFKWETLASEELTRWYKAKLMPLPDHSKLAHYTTRRLINVVKLAMVASMSRSRTDEAGIVKLQDLTRARDWLLGAEKVMPDIFRDMALRSDAAVIDNCHLYLWQAFVKNNKEPVPARLLWGYLQTQVPSEKVGRIIESMERSEMLKRAAGGAPGDERYVPQARMGVRGVE